jgi:dihydroorotate dehydrogenase (NAD+) catalytic subunit
MQLRNPVLLASGTCGYGDELSELIDLSRIGGLVTKTITPEPRAGNAPPRVFETAAGMLNSIGLQNPGLEAFIADRWSFLEALDTAIIVNIAAPSADAHARMAERLAPLSRIAAIEVNISSPNMKDGGMLFGCNPLAAAEVIGAVSEVAARPVIAKLTPNVTDIAEIARAVEDAGADAISMINTLLGMAVDVSSRRPVLGNTTGGLSGPAIKPVALALLWKVRQAVDLPLIGIGGIMDAEDALEFMIAGASAVQVGTATFVKPGAASAIVDGLEAYCAEQNLADISTIIGSLSQ